MVADSSQETMEVRRQWNNVFKTPKGKKKSTYNSMTSKMLLKNKGKINTFSDTQKLNNFISSKPEPPEIWKGSPSHRTQMPSYENKNLHKAWKNIRNGRYMG